MVDQEIAVELDAEAEAEVEVEVVVAADVGEVVVDAGVVVS